MGGFGGNSGGGGGGQDIAERQKSASNTRNTQTWSNDSNDDNTNKPSPKKNLTYIAPTATNKTPDVFTGVSNTEVDSSGSGNFGTSFFSNARPALNQQQFVAGIGEGATRDDLISGILGGDAGIYKGAQPFGEKGVDAKVLANLGLDAGVVPTDGSVEAQAFAPNISGGDPGVGLQGFGAKMMGGEGQVIGADGVPSEFEAIPTEVANSDLIDPDAMMVLPGQAIIQDQAYNMPTGMGAQGFYPNSSKAYQYQTNPFAGRLMNSRTGFGKGLFRG